MLETLTVALCRSIVVILACERLTELYFFTHSKCTFNYAVNHIPTSLSVAHSIVYISSFLSIIPQFLVFILQSRGDPAAAVVLLPGEAMALTQATGADCETLSVSVFNAQSLLG